MELLVSIAVGVLVACGVLLLLRERSFSVILGLTLLSYAANLVIFAGGRLATASAPLLLPGHERFADPLPQALVLTAIVISFGMTAYVVALALRAKGAANSDHVDGRRDPVRRTHGEGRP